MKKKPLVLIKTGHNTVRLSPENYEPDEAMKRLEWEYLPNEIIIDQMEQSIEEIMKIYPEYEVKR